MATSDQDIHDKHLQGKNLDVILRRQFLSPQLADELLARLETMNWRKKGKGKRERKDLGEPGVEYTIEFHNKGKNVSCSTIVRRQVEDWSQEKEILAARDKLMTLLQQSPDKDIEPLNYCVIQRYDNGSVGMKKHRDAEMDGKGPICGISLGSTRSLTLTPPPWQCFSVPHTLQVDHRSIYLIRPPTNDYWMHSIDTLPVDSPDHNKVRYSITFRHGISSK